MAKNTSAIVKLLYPKVTEKMTPATITKYRKVIAEFIEKRSLSLYDTCPCDRIPFGEEDANMLFSCIGISSGEVKGILSETYYWSMAAFNPAAAKDPFTVLMMCIIRFFYISKKEQELELSCMYLAFSGKFYPSIHYGSYPKVQPSEYRHIMEYVVNNELTEKYDIRKYGSVFGAVKSISKTWVATYGDMFKSFDDEDVTYLIQQLHNRIKSFMTNIAEVYYKVYNSKENYMTYDSDDMSEDSYRLADNDSFKIERYSESAMNYISNNGVDYRLCTISSNGNIRTEELKGIIEIILGDNTNLPIIKELCTLLLAEYFVTSKTKDPRGLDFISTSIAVKPNSKNPNVNRIKEIIETWLDDSSPTYRKRKSRLATKSAYNKALLTYFVLVINQAAK